MTPPIIKVTTTTSAQTTTEPVNAIIKKDLSIETRETYYYVSRVDPNITIQEETQPNFESPTMPTTQLEASHEIIVCEIVATIDRETNTEEEDTPMYRKNLQKVLGMNFIAAATRKDKNVRPLVNFMTKRDWESLKLSFGQYWYNKRNRLLVKNDCLLIDERIVLPTQLSTGKFVSHSSRICGHGWTFAKTSGSRIYTGQ